MLSEQAKGFKRIISFFNRYGYAPYIILVGSWAEYAYQISGMIDGFIPNIRTLDMDFLIVNARKPRTKKALLKDAKEEGFIVEIDPLYETARINLIEESLEIEFLICNLGSGETSFIETHLGIKVQALRHLSVLSKNSMKVYVDGYEVLVPTPEAYAIQKMIVNRKRKSKSEKDRQSILHIFPYLNSGELKRILKGISKKEQDEVARFLEDNELAYVLN